MSSKPSLNGTAMANVGTEVAPGATRSHWLMRCHSSERMVSTQTIAAENTLKIPPVLMTADGRRITASNDSSGGNVVKASEMDYETLSQELDFSQDSRTVDGKNKFSSLDMGLGLDDNIFQLSGEQKAVLNLVLNGRKNIFFTGAAGTGKSVLLRCIISQLRRKYGSSCIGITALTGIAACNIGGQTLHRFAGIGLGKDSVKDLVDKIKNNMGSRSRWETTEALLIDEVSMLEFDLLEKLEEIARIIRGNNIPFGGIQIICTGDLFQLPPVEKGVSTGKRFCFESPVWDRIIDKTVNLTQVFRQSDPRFVNVLNEIRLGYVSPESQQLFSRLSRVPKLPKGIVPTQLFSTRREVNNSNQTALKRLVGTEYVYECSDWKSDRPAARYVDIGRNIMAEERVNLKIGAQVMLIKNIDNNLVNGSIGRVVAFMSAQARYTDYGAGANNESHFRSRKIASEEGSKEEQDTEQVAKILGAYGKSASSARKRKLAEHMTEEDSKSNAVLPVVKFVTPQNTVRFMMVQPETWEMHDFEGEVLASRTQLPIILAWALSIHKSQGQTLPYVCVDLKNVFENGQAYVAISRATSVEGLQVTNFMSHKVKASHKVVDYYKQLEKVQPQEIKDAEAFFEREFKAKLEAKRLLAEAQKQEDPDFLPSSQPALSYDESELKSEVNQGDIDDGELLISEPNNSALDHISNTLCQNDEPRYNLKRPRIMIESSSPTS